MPAPEPPTSRAEAVFDWCFRNRETGAITIAQFPNVALGLFLATVVVGWLVPDGSTVERAVEWVGVAALGWWALDELLRGVNPWRRLLGVGGLALAIGGVIRLVSTG